MSGTFSFDQVKAAAITEAAEAFRLLAALRLPDEAPWLQTFADGPDALYAQEPWTDRNGNKRVALKFIVGDAPVVSGQARPRLEAVNQCGRYPLMDLTARRPYWVQNSSARVGVFCAVNGLDATAKRRSNDVVRRVVALVLDLDGRPLPLEGFPIKPTAIVESSPGHWHVYWAVSDLPLHEFMPAQKHLAKLYGGDESVSDLARVMRLPGYWHGKTEEAFLSRLVELNEDARYTRADLLHFPGLREAFGVAERETAERLQKAEEHLRRQKALRAELKRGTVTSRAEALQKYGQAALFGELGILAKTEQGKRNGQLFKSAAALGGCVAAELLGQTDVEAVLRAVALDIGLSKGETEDTLRSGMETGMKNPRDLSRVGRLVGKKKADNNLAQAATRTTSEAVSVVTADEIPDPEGEGSSYTDDQLRALLNLSWPVVGLDTDKAHSFRLNDLTGDDLGYVAGLGGYVAWNGRQWLHGRDGQVEAKRRVQGLGVHMRPEVERLLNLYMVLDLAAKRAAQSSSADSDLARQLARKAEAMEQAYYKHGRAARSTEADNKQKAILSSAETLYVKDIRLFEPQPWVVGFPNGTWDRGAFRPARREDYLLNLAGVEYEPASDRRVWLEVLERITGGDEDLARTLQDVAGYALSGASSLRLLPWLYGKGGTGKGTYSELLGTVLGELAATVDPKLFSADGARERLGAAIYGKRVVICTEAGNARLDAEVLKTLSGGDRISVRMLYAESFTARAGHVLIMVANDAPRVEAYDEALKDRVLALPFNHLLKIGAPLLGGRRVEELRQDPNSDLVKGFTAWAVEGLARVYQQGDIHQAAVCEQATRGFWENVDPLHDFWMEQSVAELVSGLPVRAFREKYETWCHRVGGRPVGSQTLNKACRSVGLDQHNAGKYKIWKLLRPALYPVGPSSEGGDSAHFADFDPSSLKPDFSSPTREEEKGFMENSPQVGKVGIVSTLILLAPASGEL